MTILINSTNVFFPTLKKRGIDTVLDLGDTYDNVDSRPLGSNRSKTEYWNKLRDMGVTVHSLVGVTAYFKDTNDINTLDGILKYNNIHIYNKATEVKIGGHLFYSYLGSINKIKKRLMH